MYESISVMCAMSQEGNKSGSEFTTISLSRDFKQELEQELEWNMSFQDYLKSELDVYDKGD